MNNKKNIAIIMMITVLSITGCSNTTEYMSPSSDEDIPVSNVESTIEAHDSTVESDRITIQGLCGEDISVTDFIAENLESNPDFADFKFPIYSYEGFGYYSPSDGNVLYKYDCDPFAETDEVEDCQRDYQHIDVGNEICGLKLESASGMLFGTNGEISLEQQELYFSGSLEMEGFVYICRGDEGYRDENEIIFLPADGEWKGLPFNYHQGDFKYLGENYEFYWCGNACVLSLGNISDYDIPELSEGGHSVREAVVTISSLIIRDCFTDMFFGASSYVKSATLDSIRFK